MTIHFTDRIILAAWHLFIKHLYLTLNIWHYLDAWHDFHNAETTALIFKD